jgi:hypothetical protein
MISIPEVERGDGSSFHRLTYAPQRCIFILPGYAANDKINLFQGYHSPISMKAVPPVPGRIVPKAHAISHNYFEEQELIIIILLQKQLKEGTKCIRKVMTNWILPMIFCSAIL